MDGIHYPRPSIPDIFQAKWAMLYLSSGLSTSLRQMVKALMSQLKIFISTISMVIVFLLHGEIALKSVIIE